MKWLFLTSILCILLFINIANSMSYLPLDNAQIIVAVTDWTGKQLDANCTVTVFYPNKTLMNHYTMAKSPTGNHYIQFTAPNVTGIYEFNVTCILPNRVLKKYGTFQVSSISQHLQNLANITISAQYNISQNITGNLTEAFNTAFNTFYKKIRNDIILLAPEEKEGGFSLLGMFVADTKNQVCIDNRTLRIYTNKTYRIGNETIFVRRYVDKVCENGCRNNSCIIGVNAFSVVMVTVIILMIFSIIYFIMT